MNKYKYVFSIVLIFICSNVMDAGKTGVLFPVNREGVKEFGRNKGVIDTLSPTWEGPLYLYYQAIYRNEYEATKLTPAGPCSVISLAHGVASREASKSKQCSLFIWSDNAGSPGAVLYKARVTASTVAAKKIEYNWYSVTPPVYVTGPFWMGNCEWDTLFPSSSIDSNRTSPNKYFDTDSNKWLDDYMDYFHIAVVNYVSTGTPEISASPKPIIFHIDSLSSKSFSLSWSPVPQLTEEDDEYWKDIVPGELIIGYSNIINVKTASLQTLGITEKAVTLTSRELGCNFVLVDFNGDISEEKAFLKRMKSKSGVKSVEPNRIFKPFRTPNDTYWSSQWDKVNLNAPAAWDSGWGSDSISIGIIDQGAQYTHPDLSLRFGSVKGYDYRDNDADPINATSSEAHGTHCAGIAAATINNGAGVAGMSNSRLYSLRFMSESGGNTTALSNSIQWCRTNGVNIISMSTGGGGYSDLLAAQCSTAYNAGCLLFAATGNDGAETICYPAGFYRVLAVGSINSSNQRSSFSNYGTNMKFSSPGDANIWSTIPGNSYAGPTWAGTSMACPQVAGGAALVWSANPKLKNSDIANILISTATDLGTSGWDKYYGYGKPNLGAAVIAAKNMKASSADTGVLTVYNSSSATGALFVSAITHHSSWIKSVTPTSFTVAAGSSQGVDIIVEAQLHTGYYYDTLFIASNDPGNNPYPVQVVLRVGDVGVEEQSNSDFGLGILDLNVSPNPIARLVSIKFAVLSSQYINLRVYDTAGRVVKTIFDGSKTAGNYTLTANTSGLSSGIYFVSLTDGNTRISKKITVIK
ncbi:MAG: S8 family peptidase [bacterium]|nr:S8 family peptidase [bacterium]